MKRDEMNRCTVKLPYLSAAVLFLLLNVDSTVAQKNQSKPANMSETVVKSEEEWRGCLTPEEYRILRDKGTEMAFTGKYNKHSEDGVYTCAGCGAELFSSETKYDSGSGWPSFWKPISEEKVHTETDNSLFMKRTEIICSRCGGHLGHMFEDGPRPTGLRYCVNSVSLGFEPQEVETVSKEKEDSK